MASAMVPGNDIVWGRRRSRRHDPVVSRLLAGAFYRVFRILTGLEYPPSGVDFVMFSKRVSQAILEHRQRNLSLFLLLYNLGHGQREVEYDRGERTAGASGWTFVNE